MYFTFPQFNKFPLKSFFRKFSEKFLLEKLNNIFPNYNIVFTDSGRSAFQLAIESLNLQNTEMILPAYICDIFRPILKHYNIKPIHIDTDLKTFQTNLADIEPQITPNTKSILVCHTYGLPVDMDHVSKIARNYNLKIIEDCAHIWPSKIYGDCAFFSFMKLFPVTNGGMLVSENYLNVNLEKYTSKTLDKIKLLRLSPKLANFSEKFRPKERLTERQRNIPKKISKTSLKIVNFCLDGFKEQVERKITLAKYFQNKLINLNFEVQENEDNTFTYLSALVPENIDRDKLFHTLKEYNVFCSRIWQDPLLKQLPNTSIVAKRIINFPLQDWYTEQDIDKIVKCLIATLAENAGDVTNGI
jgi:dTDP-4-amino-4,6-dideoxygalactose transaminase